jgi:hypothetical protein
MEFLSFSLWSWFPPRQQVKNSNSAPKKPYKTVLKYIFAIFSQKIEFWIGTFLTGLKWKKIPDLIPLRSMTSNHRSPCLCCIFHSIFDLENIFPSFAIYRYLSRIKSQWPPDLRMRNRFYSRRSHRVNGPCKIKTSPRNF